VLVKLAAAGAWQVVMITRRWRRTAPRLTQTRRATSFSTSGSSPPGHAGWIQS